MTLFVMLIQLIYFYCRINTVQNHKFSKFTEHYRSTVEMFLTFSGTNNKMNNSNFEIYKIFVSTVDLI